MDYKFLDSAVDIENIILPESEKINPFLLKNNYADIIKGIDFINSKDITLYVHGFLGTGKRQYINYISEFLSRDVIKLEYYCKESTVCDDILLAFINAIDKSSTAKVVNNLNAKITTLSVKFQQYISALKKPFFIILHSFDDIMAENKDLVCSCLSDIVKMDNVKIVVSTRAMVPDVLGDIAVDRKIFLKALTKEIFSEYLAANNISGSGTAIDDFYKYTRGYYYYTALSIKIIQAMKISLNDFLQKFAMSGISFDSYLGMTYINLIPATIRNFFWFLRTIRHGLTINALAVFELYDEFSLEYLKSNLMIFIVGETVYVQDYFLQNIDISIPKKTEIKLHKYIISIYEEQLKEPLQSRTILISRQALRAEIEYHNKCIRNLESDANPEIDSAPAAVQETQNKVQKDDLQAHPAGIDDELKKAASLSAEKKFTEAIEIYLKILDAENIDLHTVINSRLALARLYKETGDYYKSSHYYELVETFYKQHNEVINLNYLYYEITSLYFLMYKNDRAIETIKKVIYSVDTPQSLMVSACTLLGNIYSRINNPDEAFSYYQKALDSLDEKTGDDVLAELYFKFGLANDDRGDEKAAFEYYTKCTGINRENPYKALAYSNMGSCYFDNENYSDAKDCFKKAYDIEKGNNNYDGIYYDASYLAKICIKENSKDALNYLLEAKQSAEFINEDFYILQATVALGDYYYNNISLNKKALTEYFKARKTAQNLSGSVDTDKIEQRINDMRLRMDKDVFDEIEKKYG